MFGLVRSDTLGFVSTGSQRRRRLKQFAKAGIDAVIAAVAIFLAFYIRFDGAIPPIYVQQLGLLIVAVVVGKGVINYSFGAYRQIWQYTSVREAEVLFIGSVLAAGLLVVLRTAGIFRIPNSVLVIDWALYLLAGGGVRVLRRVQIQAKARGLIARDKQVPVLFVGAGSTAHALLSELKRQRGGPWRVVGLLDDNPSKQGGTILGAPIIGSTTDLGRILRTRQVQHVVIAMPSAERGVIRDMMRTARRYGATLQVVPAIRDMIRNNKAANANPKVTLADLMDSKEVSRALLPTASSANRDSSVLVTGGAGYIGSHLVRKLLDAGYRVRILDNFLNGDHGLAPIRHHENLEVIQGDISSVRDVVASVKDVGTVIALAAIVGDPACGVDAEETLNLNYESTKILVEACNFYGVRRLVFASSCSVYGASDEDLLTESSPLNPVSLYARTRIMSENVIFERADEVVPVVLRLATVFGLSPRMRFDLVVNTLTVHAVVEGKMRITGGDQWRPFVHCSDAAQAFMLAATGDATRVGHKIFNVGNESMNHTIADVGRLVTNQVPGVSTDMQNVIDDPRNYRVSFERIRNAMGFVPEYDLESGIREIVQALEDRPELRDYRNRIYSNLKVMAQRAEESGFSPLHVEHAGSGADPLPIAHRERAVRG